MLYSEAWSKLSSTGAPTGRRYGCQHINLINRRNGNKETKGLPGNPIWREIWFPLAYSSYSSPRKRCSGDTDQPWSEEATGLVALTSQVKVLNSSLCWRCVQAQGKVGQEGQLLHKQCSAVTLSLCECWKWEAAQCHNHGLSVKSRIQTIPTFAAIINIKSIYVVTFSVPIMISCHKREIFNPLWSL